MVTAISSLFKHLCILALIFSGDFSELILGKLRSSGVQGIAFCSFIPGSSPGHTDSSL